MKQSIYNKIKDSESDFAEARAYGYEIHKFQNWHYRVSHVDYDTQVDVWPTTGKIWKVDSGYTTTYKTGELVQKIEKIFEQEDIENRSIWN